MPVITLPSGALVPGRSEKTHCESLWCWCWWWWRIVALMFVLQVHAHGVPSPVIERPWTTSQPEKEREREAQAHRKTHRPKR